MKERPILFSAPMVRAILEGRKTQTRRLVKVPDLAYIGPGQDAYDESDPYNYGYANEYGDYFTLGDRRSIPCPHGQPGDRLWVRETWRTEEFPCGFRYRADDVFRSAEGDAPQQAGEAWARTHRGGSTISSWRPSIHMPRWASRITLEVQSVRVERLQSITEEDARAEGAIWHDGGGVGHSGWRHDPTDGYVWGTARDSFRRLWSLINGDESDGAASWGSNPWVWVVSFARVEAGRRAA